MVNILLKAVAFIMAIFTTIALLFRQNPEPTEQETTTTAVTETTTAATTFAITTTKRELTTVPALTTRTTTTKLYTITAPTTRATTVAHPTTWPYFETTIPNTAVTTAPYNTRRHITEYVTQLGTPVTTAKFGVLTTVTPAARYAVYSDGSRVQTRTWDEVNVDYSGYNATPAQLQAEAELNRVKYAEYINVILADINATRAAAGASPLVLNETLCTAACVRATEMAWSDVYSHDRPDGSEYYTVLDEFGYYNRSSGENIAIGYKSPEAVCDAWNASEGHYENTVRTYYTDVGIGVAESPEGVLLWAELFTKE